MIWWAVLFFGIGIVLILAELILPGLVCGILGAASLVASCAIAISWRPDLAIPIIFVEATSAVVCVIVGFYVFPKTFLGRAMILDTTLSPESGWVSDETDEDLVGALGEVYSALRPSGSIMVKGRRINAVSSGEFVDEGAAVRVIEASGNRVVVEPVAK
jgi:membrane-bound serine protease (ClpP class)